MCIVSMVFDYGRETWPQQPTITSPNLGTPIIQQPAIPSVEEWKEFLELVEKAKKFDELTGQPDCEDPEKGKWMEAVEARLAQLEKEPKKRYVVGTEYLGDGDHGDFNGDIFEHMETEAKLNLAEINLRHALGDGEVKFQLDTETGDVKLLSFNGKQIVD